MGFLDKTKEAVENGDGKIGSKLDAIITGKKKDAESEVKSAVDEGEAELAKFESMIKDKESEFDSVAADIGKKVLASVDEGKSFDISSISDLLDKAKGIKSCIDEITSKISALKG